MVSNLALKSCSTGVNSKGQRSVILARVYFISKAYFLHVAKVTVYFKNKFPSESKPKLERNLAKKVMELRLSNVLITSRFPSEVNQSGPN